VKAFSLAYCYCTRKKVDSIFAGA